MGDLCWQEPVSWSGVTEWRGWDRRPDGGPSRATITKDTHPERPYQACVRYEPIGRWPTLDEAIEAVRLHDASSAASD